MPQRKLLEWKPPHPDSIAVKKLQTGTHQRRQRYRKTPQACLSSLTPPPHCFLRSMLEGPRSGFLLVALPRYPRGHGDSGQEFLGSSQPFWSHQLQLLDDSLAQISWQHVKSSQLAVDDWAWWSAFLAFTLELHQHSVHCRERNLEVFCYLPLT